MNGEEITLHPQNIIWRWLLGPAFIVVTGYCLIQIALNLRDIPEGGMGLVLGVVAIGLIVFVFSLYATVLSWKLRLRERAVARVDA